MQVIGTYEIEFGEDAAELDLYITHGDVIHDKEMDNKQMIGVLDSAGLSLFFHGELMIRYGAVPEDMLQKAKNIYIIEKDYQNEAQLAIKIVMDFNQDQEDEPGMNAS